MPGATTLAPIYREVEARLAAGGRVSEIARALGVSYGLVYGVKRRVAAGRALGDDEEIPEQVSLAEVRSRLAALIDRLEEEDGPLEADLDSDFAG